MSWKQFEKESLPLPLKPVLFYLVDNLEQKFTIMSGHINQKNNPRVFDIFSGKFKAIPKKYKITQWWLQEPEKAKVKVIDLAKVKPE